MKEVKENVPWKYWPLIQNCILNKDSQQDVNKYPEYPSSYHAELDLERLLKAINLGKIELPLRVLALDAQTESNCKYTLLWLLFATSLSMFRLIIDFFLKNFYYIFTFLITFKDTITMWSSKLNKQPFE